jgi:hypothetical protein
LGIIWIALRAVPFIEQVQIGVRDGGAVMVQRGGRVLEFGFLGGQETKFGKRIDFFFGRLAFDNLLEPIEQLLLVAFQMGDQVVLPQ